MTTVNSTTAMSTSDPAIHGDDAFNLETASELRRHVKWTLCRREHLDPTQFSMTEVPLVRAGRRCGVSFRVRGPRAVTLMAIWVADQKRLLFYDSAGTRFLVEQLDSCSAEL